MLPEHFLFRSGLPSVFFQLRGTQSHTQCYTISTPVFSQYVASLRAQQEELQGDLINSTERLGIDRTMSCSAAAMGKFSQLHQLHKNVLSLPFQSSSLGLCCLGAATGAHCTQSHLKTALITVRWEIRQGDAITALFSLPGEFAP